MSLPASPMNSEPLSIFGTVSPSSRSVGYFLPPSYQVTRTGGRSPRSGKSYLIMDQFGGLSAVAPSDSASTETGYESLSDQKMGSIRWHAISPSAPVPKSHQPRQTNGRYAL